MKRVLVADTLPEKCHEMLRDAGLEVDYQPGLAPEELKEAVRGASGIICRSGVTITADVLEGADALEAVCRAGVGVDNIDVAAASRKGVVVMNTPGANTLSTAEHAFALMLGLARNVAPAYLAMREGRWEKKKFVGSQLAGSTLAIIGLGRIGQTIARRARAFDMEVLAYDPYVSRDSAEKLGVRLVDDLDEVLANCDYLTVHVPENEQTEGMIGAREIGLMRDGACIINCARGSVVDQEAALAALGEGRLGGFAVDVYPQEPPPDFSFAQNDRVLATPHLAASTEEAQLAVATEAAEQLIDALLRNHYRNALNMTPVPPEEMKALQPYCDLAARLGKLAAQMNRGRPQSLEIACRGELAHRAIEPVVDYGAMGVLRTMLGDSVNIVSAPHLAEERGILVTSKATTGMEAGFTDLIEVRLTTDEGTFVAAGTVFGRKHPRIVRIGDFYAEVIPDGHVLAVFCTDAPGLIGQVCGVLGAAGINIARMGFGREKVGGKALLALNLDSPCEAAALEEIRALELVDRVVPVEL